MFLYVDNADPSQTRVPKTKAVSKLHIGGIPHDGHDCLENSVKTLIHDFNSLIVF